MGLFPEKGEYRRKTGKSGVQVWPGLMNAASQWDWRDSSELLLLSEDAGSSPNTHVCSSSCSGPKLFF